MKLPILFCLRAALALFAALLIASALPAQLTQDQQADMLLNSARKAYNEKNYAFAQTKFREFLTKFGGHKDAAAARYGLGLTLLDGAEKKYDEARDIMTSLAATKDFADRQLATYYAGVAVRGLGLQSLAQAETAPERGSEAPALQCDGRVSTKRSCFHAEPSRHCWARSKSRSRTAR